MTQNTGLVAYQDDDNFVKFVYGPSMGRRGGGATAVGATPVEQPGTVQLILESKGEQKAVANLSMEGIITSDNSFILKIEKKGSSYLASVSSDGATFKTVGTAEIVLKDIQAGIMACEGVASARMGGFGGRPNAAAAPAQPTTPFVVSFDYFRISNSGLK